MRTPPDVLKKFEQASVDLDYGKVTLTRFTRQGHTRYTVTREESFFPEEQSGDDFVESPDNEPTRSVKVIVAKRPKSELPTIQRYCLEYLIARRA